MISFELHDSLYSLNPTERAALVPLRTIVTYLWKEKSALFLYHGSSFDSSAQWRWLRSTASQGEFMQRLIQVVLQDKTAYRNGVCPNGSISPTNPIDAARSHNRDVDLLIAPRSSLGKTLRGDENLVQIGEVAVLAFEGIERDVLDKELFSNVDKRLQQDGVSIGCKNVFVEGIIDHKLLEYAMEILFPEDKRKELRIRALNGCTAATMKTDQIADALCTLARERPRIAARTSVAFLFDGDKVGIDSMKKAKKRWVEIRNRFDKHSKGGKNRRSLNKWEIRYLRIGRIHTRHWRPEDKRTKDDDVGFEIEDLLSEETWAKLQGEGALNNGRLKREWKEPQEEDDPYSIPLVKFVREERSVEDTKFFLGLLDRLCRVLDEGNDEPWFSRVEDSA